MKKSINKFCFKHLMSIFASRSDLNRLSKTVKSDRESVIEIYRSFFFDTKKKFDSLFDISRQVQDRLDYQRYLIRKMSIIFSSLIVLLSVSIILISI